MTQTNCPNCNKTNQPTSRFCIHCGQKITKMAHATRQSAPIYLGALILVAAIYLGISMRKNRPQAPPDPAHHEHNHPALTEQERSQLDSLRQAAKSGQATDLIELSEFLIQSAGENNELFAEAATVMEKILQQHPDHGYTLRMMGDLHFEWGHHAEAIKHYTRYLERYPDDANVWTDLGTQYFYSGNSEKAIESYRKALDIYPDFYNPHFNLHLVYKGLEDSKSADAELAIADEILKRKGKGLAPETKLSRFPSGQGDPHPPVQQWAELNDYFKQHPIMGNKLRSFDADGEKVVVSLAQFPINAMPPAAREVFESKIKAKLEEIGRQVNLEIRDADSNALLSSFEYSGK